MKWPILIVFAVTAINSLGAVNYTNKVPNLAVATNATVGGYLSLSGQTNRLTVASGELKLDGTTIGSGGGSSPWTNVSGVIKPAPGQTTNVLQFTSGLADSDTNTALVVSTSVPWTSDEASLISAGNVDTNVFSVGPEGQVAFGRGTLDWWGSVSPGAIVTHGDATLKELVLGYVNGGSQREARLQASSSGPLLSLATQDGDSVVISGSANPSITAKQVQSEPAAPSAGYFTLFAVDNGSGKMALKALFPSGASQPISVEGGGVVNYPTSLGTDDTYQGAQMAGLNNSGGVTQWDTVYLNSSSQWVLADANGTGTYPARGIVSATVATGNATTVITSGTIRNDAWNWTPGGTIYLSTTPGGLTQTAPSTTGDKVQVIGYALTADIMAVAISPDYGTAP